MSFTGHFWVIFETKSKTKFVNIAKIVQLI